MIAKAADIADVIKAFSALWRSLYAVAPIQIAAKKVPITIRSEFIVSVMGAGPSSHTSRRKISMRVAEL